MEHAEIRENTQHGNAQRRNAEHFHKQILLLLLMTGIVLGGFIGNMASGVRGLSWLNYGQSFGLMDPVVLDLGILVITFGLSIRVTMASIIGVVIALIAYRLI